MKNHEPDVIRSVPQHEDLLINYLKIINVNVSMTEVHLISDYSCSGNRAQLFQIAMVATPGNFSVVTLTKS